MADDKLENEPDNPKKSSGSDFRSKFVHEKQDIVRQLLSKHFSEEATKLNVDAQKMMTEFFRLFVSEACARAAEQASEYEGVDYVTPEHLQKILAQLMLDFA